MLLMLLFVSVIEPAQASGAAPSGIRSEALPDTNWRLPVTLSYVDSAHQHRHRFAPETNESPRSVDSIGNVALWTGFGGIRDGCNGAIFATARMANGDLVVGGDFTVCGGASANHVARWDGSSWTSLGTGTAGGGYAPGRVSALVAIGTDLYAGGMFSEAGGVAAKYIARWNGNAWSSVGNGADLNGDVNALAAIGTDLYAGGFFEQAGGAPTYGVARWDGAAWSSLGNGLANGVDTNVYALATIGTDLYVGGDFTLAGGAYAIGIARWNGSAWSSLGTGYPGVNGEVYAIAAIGPDLYVGGSFFEAGGTAAKNVARWDGSTWSGLGAGVGVGFSSVNALAVIGADLYAGGDSYVTQAGGVAANHIAHWDGSVWSSLGIDAGNGVDSVVAALTVIGTDLYAGGYFTQAGGAAANRIARWDGGAWSTLGNDAGNGMDSYVYAMAAIDTDLYVGGDFIHDGNATANGIARLHDGTWSSLEAGLNYSGYSADAYAFAASGTDLYVGGSFTQAGGQAANRIARWNGNAWSSLGSGVENGVNSSVNALAMVGTDLYVGGAHDFTQAGSVAANHIARWNGSTWSSLGIGAGNGVSSSIAGGGSINALATSGTDLYVGGFFDQAGGQAANGVARWDGNAWSALGTGVDNVYALAAIGTDLYAGGSFNQAGGVAANNIARWNGVAWSSLGTGAGNGMNGSVFVLAAVGSDLYVGGYFTQAGGVEANNIARWDGSAWSSVGTGASNGVKSGVNALAAVGTVLYVGGRFGEAGGQVSSNIAKVTFLADELFGNGFEGPPGGDPCANLGRISVGNTPFKWPLQGSGTVTYGDNTSANGIPFTSYTSVWNEGSANPWPGAAALSVRLGLIGTVYLAEAFTAPVDGSVTGTIKWLNNKAGVGYSAASNAASYAISTCAGDFGQPGTQLGPNCSADIASTTGLSATVSNSPVAGVCTLAPGKTYYLNMLQAPLAGIAATSAAFSSCSSNCAPWTLRQ